MYSSAPCKKLDYLQVAIDAVRQDERDLRAADIAIRQLASLLLTQRNEAGTPDPAVSAKISEHIGEIAMIMNNRSPSTELIKKMSQISGFTEEWRGI